MHQPLNNIDLVLLDIEGTICPITFVKDTLFPYALDALSEVIRQDWDHPSFKPYKDAFPDDFRKTPEDLQRHVQDLTKRDVKVAYLKNLQGYLWQSGYESKAYATPLYPDVVPCLKNWRRFSKAIVIYSSGSVFAQKLLFAHVKTDTISNPDPQNVTSTEDLTSLISGWFDTINAGPKTAPSSYEKIANALNTVTDRVLFLSDNVKEVSAAREAGMRAIVVDRPGNTPLSEDDLETFEIIESFEELRTQQVRDSRLETGPV